MSGANQYNREPWDEGAGVYRGAGGAGYARVHVRRCVNERTATISVTLDDDPRNDQLKRGGFEDWIAASIFGCRYACDIAGAKSGSWEIRRIVGILVDTTAPFVAIAAARAVWEICQYPASELENKRLDEHAITFHFDPLENSG